jgi:hypothetical protein
MNSTVTYGSEAIRAEMEAIEAAIAALRAKFSSQPAYFAEMDRLVGLLRKYRHRWCVYNAAGERQEPSQRMYDWVDRYSTLAGSTDLFFAWCDARGYAYHDVYDVLA